MDKLTALILDDMKPSLGVTEPGAIALATSTAYSYVPGDVVSVDVAMNSGMYKNAFTCGIPNTTKVGAAYAAALGILVGRLELGLESLRDITESAVKVAEQWIQAGKVKIRMTCVSPEIFISAAVKTESGIAEVTIEHSHTNITRINCNGACIYKKDVPPGAADRDEWIEDYAFSQLIHDCSTVPVSELSFLDQAFAMNYALLEKGLADPHTVIAHHLLEKNKGQQTSDNVLASAQLLASGAIEARVLGISAPAMSITGSGSHGIIAIMPLYAIYMAHKCSHEELLRASALSILITKYIKSFSGKLSALCGCGVAAGSGAACGIAMLYGANEDQIAQTLSIMALGITGMICDGGNHGCALKCAAAVDAAFRAVDFALSGAFISPEHGICGLTPEETMQNIGHVANPGMLGTEKSILDILSEKEERT